MDKKGSEYHKNAISRITPEERASLVKKFKKMSRLYRFKKFMRWLMRFHYPSIIVHMFTQDMGRFYKLLVYLEFVRDDGSPLHCMDCDSTNFKMVTTDYLDYLPVEKKCICKDCGRQCGYWSYGQWQL